MTPVCIPKKDEISHVIALKGSHAERVLYGYIELFNCHKFLIRLNLDYSGPDFKDTYVFNVRTKEVIDVTIDLNMSRKFIEEYDHHIPPVEQQYFDCLGKVMSLVA